MDNFIFSIEEIFSTCLSQNQVEGYYIAPYQRGYKWKSKTKYDHIPVLLTDLFEAYSKNKEISNSKEYFLQYITVKRTIVDMEQVFEVIDGQQRLTTLCILFSVIAENHQYKNITTKKGKFLLNYARYEDAESHIFVQILHLLKDPSIVADKLQEQDKFYMLEAAKSIACFFKIVSNNGKEEFDGFLSYLKENVKIILNKEDEFTSAEDVFSSLNANRVPLTDAYLIKGLLLTKAARGITNQNKRKPFKEIMDERTIMGRTWDEMNTWFEQKEIGLYFFGNNNKSLEKMLRLVDFKNNKKSIEIINHYREGLNSGEKNYDTSYKLFNHFHDHILTSEDSRYCLMEIKHIYKRLKSWYQNDFIYNMLGLYLMDVKDEDKKSQILIKLLSAKNDELLQKIKEHFISKFLSEKELMSLRYPNKKLVFTLLALSICPEDVSLNEEMDYRFNFQKYLEEKWSLEHIYPQNPKKGSFKVQDDKDYILREINEEITRRKDNEDEITKLKLVKERIENESEIDTNEIKFIYDKYSSDLTDGIGNMALLSGSVNTALSNGFFNTKRKVLLSLINKGNFVPKHTLDVFSKMLEQPKEYTEHFDATLVNWTSSDIKAHREWIINRLKEIKNTLSQ